MLALAAGLAGCETNTEGIVEQATTDEVVEGNGLSSAEGDHPCGPRHAISAYLPEQALQWTPDGTHLLFDHLTTIKVVDVEGTRLSTLFDADPRYLAEVPTVWLFLPDGIYFDVSPDGKRVVYTSCEFRQEGQNVDPELAKFAYEIAVINMDGTEKQRLTWNDVLDHYPVWSPDGKRIGFYSHNFAYWNLLTMAEDGSDVRRLVGPRTLAFTKGNFAVSEPIIAPPVWSPDGELIAFLVFYRGGHLYTIRADGTDATRIARTITSVRNLRAKFPIFWSPVLPAWSPDGELLAFVMADEEGAPVGVFMVRPDGTDLTQVLESQGAEWQVSQVLWSPDGSELLIASDSHYFIVKRDGSNALRVELENPLDQAWRVGAWSPDGARIALYVPGNPYENIPPQLYTVARDGTDLRTLVRADADGNLVPANPPEDE
jgi:dipeptidyl aminopeptidase/acylaminoacyl peptidase